jgi:hypothetical protein
MFSPTLIPIPLVIEILRDGSAEPILHQRLLMLFKLNEQWQEVSR